MNLWVKVLSPQEGSQFLMNVYSDDLHTAVDFLSNTAPLILPHLKIPLNTLDTIYFSC